jgi:hypothetical protein
VLPHRPSGQNGEVGPGIGPGTGTGRALTSSLSGLAGQVRLRVRLRRTFRAAMRTWPAPCPLITANAARRAASGRTREYRRHCRRRAVSGAAHAAAANTEHWITGGMNLLQVCSRKNGAGARQQCSHNGTSPRHCACKRSGPEHTDAPLRYRATRYAVTIAHLPRRR